SVGETASPAPRLEVEAGTSNLPRKRRRAQLRPWLRALHRDIGYLAVGFTFIYALSGLAVNHIADWDPNFHESVRTHQLGSPLKGEDGPVSARVLKELEINETPRELYRASDSRLEIVFDKRALHVDTATGVVVEEAQKPRFFLRVANYLHLNRGKKAWTYVADAYAVFLLFLAISGLFMIPGRKGLFGRGAVLTALGIAVPALYVVLSRAP
ncbi:MAG TPA: PepSY-associated TM helix domain-containing protein, partial [Polyangiaceae bacterium]|nr:PepSY-associated TM helix domain-containing protein [Polyangiaceae bacterium]